MWQLDYKEGWALKNGCFGTVVLEKTLESPLDCKEINQSILKEISPEYSLEGQMLKLQYFDQLMWIANSLEKTLMLVKIEGRRRKGRQGWLRWLDGVTNSTDMSLSKPLETVKDRKAWHAAVHRVTELGTIEWLNKDNNMRNSSTWSTFFSPSHLPPFDLFYMCIEEEKTNPLWPGASLQLTAGP